MSAQELYPDAFLSGLAACRIQERSRPFGEMRWQQLSGFRARSEMNREEVVKG